MKGKKIDFRADGFDPNKSEKVIISISKGEGTVMVAPSTRINVYGMPQKSVVAFICGAISYSLSRFGTIDASNWERNPVKGEKHGNR